MLSRINNLNSHKLGGVDDFIIITSVHLGKDNAGQFETSMLQKFKKTNEAYECKSENTYSKETIDAKIQDVIQIGARLLKPYSRELFEFISCREYHKHDLFGESDTTKALRKIKEKHIPDIMNTSHLSYLWIEHGVILGRETIYKECERKYPQLTKEDV